MFIINEEKLLIGHLELNRDNLIVVDKTKKYEFVVTLSYNWSDINKLKIGKKEKINFNEYIISENNESALIWPSDSYVEKINPNQIEFYFKFENFDDICFMNEKGQFEKNIEFLEIKVNINCNDILME